MATANRRGVQQHRACWKLIPSPAVALLWARFAVVTAFLVIQPAVFLQPAGAAGYPERPIKVVTPFAPGAASDVELRILAEKMTEILRVPVIVENRPGAGGVAAARAVTSARPDGYTLLWVGNNTAISVSLFREAFDPTAEMRPIVGVSEFPYLFVTNDKSPYRSLIEFIAAAREHPDDLKIGTSSAGTSNHLAAHLFALQLKLKVTVVPYRGPSELKVALLRDDIELVVNAYGGLQGDLSAKRIRALAVTSANRMPELPDVPTMAEQGVPDFQITSWNGLYAPKAMPTESLKLLESKVTQILQQPEIIARFKLLGFDAAPVPADRFDERMRSEITRWRDVVAAAGIENP